MKQLRDCINIVCFAILTKQNHQRGSNPPEREGDMKDIQNIQKTKTRKLKEPVKLLQMIIRATDYLTYRIPCCGIDANGYDTAHWSLTLNAVKKAINDKMGEKINDIDITLISLSRNYGPKPFLCKHDENLISKFLYPSKDFLEYEWKDLILAFSYAISEIRIVNWDRRCSGEGYMGDRSFGGSGFFCNSCDKEIHSATDRHIVVRCELQKKQSGLYHYYCLDCYNSKKLCNAGEVELTNLRGNPPEREGEGCICKIG
jgi:hypothetical protein